MKDKILTTLTTAGKVFSFFVLWSISVAFIPIPNSSDPSIWRFWAELIPLFSVVILTILFWLLEKRKISVISFQSPLKNTILGIAIGFLWFMLSIGILMLSNILQIVDAKPIPHLAIWIFSAFLNVIMQELLFRGYMYHILKRQWNISVATIVTTILFTAMHGGAFEAGLISVLNVVTMSIFVSLVMEYTQSILTPIFIHAFWNIVGCIFFNVVALAEDYPSVLTTVFQGNSLLSGGNVKLEGSIVVLILNISFCVIFYFFNLKKNHLQ